MNAVGSFFRSIYKNKRAFVGFLILLIFVFSATLGSYLVPLDTTTRFSNRYLPPSWEYPLGTDMQGRSTFALLVHGSRDVLFIGFMSAIFAILLGFTLGALVGFVGGWVDRAVDFVANIFLTLPQVPVLLILSAFIKVSHPVTLSLIIGGLSWAQLARVVRSQIMSLKHREFISICRIMGFSNLYIIFVEMLPNLVSYLAISFIQSMQAAINMSTLLIMMGFAPFSVTHWGTLQAASQAAAAGSFAPKTLLYMFSPMVCFSLLSTACVLFASGLDEALNPRLRGH